MTDLRFHGFPTGARVDLSVTHENTTLDALIESWPETEAMSGTTQQNNDGDSDGGSGGGSGGSGSATGIVTGGGNGTATLTILADWRNQHATAPESVWFETDLQGVTLPTRTPLWDEQMHQIDYVWDFGDGGSFAKSSRLPSGWALRNAGWGKRVGHVYKEPGTYTVICTAYLPTYDGATHGYEVLATATHSVTVADPDVLYAGDRTVVVDPDGDFSDAPAGAQTATDLMSLRTLRTADGKVSDGGARILLRRGKTYPLLQRWEFRGGTDSHWMFAAFGTGARPIIDLAQTDPEAGNTDDSFANVNGNKSRIAFQDIAFQGGWDSHMEQGPIRKGIVLIQNANLVVDNCHFSGLSMNLQSQGNAPEGTERTQVFAVNDSEITNWQDYGIGCFAGDANVYLLTGNKLNQQQNASSFCAGGKQHPNNRHGPLRIARLTAGYIAQNDFYSRNSWGQNDTYQPCSRLNTAGSAGIFLYYGRNVLEGGGGMISFGPANDSEPLHPGNCLMERNLMLGSTATTVFVGLSMGGSTFRGNYCVMPDVPSFGTIFSYWASSDDPGEGQGVPENRTEPVRVIGNSFINLRSDWNRYDLTEQDLHAGLAGKPYDPAVVEVRDNLIHVPNDPDHSHTPHGPLELLFQAETLEINGPRKEVPADSGIYVDYPDRITPPDGLPVLVPAAGNPVGASAAGVTPALPFFGGAPVAAPHKGALPPAS